MNFEIPSEEMRSIAAPVLERASRDLAEQLVAAAKAFAQERESGYMDKEAAAAYLGLKSQRALENWMRPLGEGGRGLPHFKFGETVRFSRARIDAWAISQEANRIYPEVAL